jgi:DNA-binding IclR family transcriptional regulator
MCHAHTGIDRFLVENAMLVSLGRGLDVLELLARAQQDLALAEIAKSLALSKGGAYKLLDTLWKRGYVDKESGGYYRLGFKAWEISSSTPRLRVIQAAVPIMHQLSAELGESIVLGVLSGADVLYVRTVVQPHAVRVHAEVGTRAPAHSVSSGLVLLAALPDDTLDRILPRPLPAVTPHTITSRAALLRELESIRQNGFAVARGSWRVDVVGCSAAIVGPDGNAWASLCATAPSYRTSEAWLRRAVKKVVPAAGSITDLLKPKRGNADYSAPHPLRRRLGAVA